MTKRAWLLIACAGVVAGGVALFGAKDEPAQRQAAPGPLPSTSGDPTRPLHAALIPEGSAYPHTAAARSPGISSKPDQEHEGAAEREDSSDHTDILNDDPKLTARLAALRTREPELALEMTRAALEREPNHPDVPERSWIVIRALVDLNRRDEGKQEARELVRRFPKSPWALDAERHLLVHP